MTDAGSRPPTVQVNAFLSPAYWGSLGAFVISLAGFLVMTALGGPPEHMMVGATGMPQSPFLYGSFIVIVAAYVLRYYAAVSVHVFGFSGESLFSAPRDLRTAWFCALCVLILLAGVNSFLISSVSVTWALIGCIAQSIIALACMLTIWVAKKIQPDRYGRVDVPRAHWEFFFLVGVGYLLYVLARAGEGTPPSGLFVGGVMAWTIFFSAQELHHRYARELWRQLQDLWRILRSA